jgi:hypothetical protein
METSALFKTSEAPETSTFVDHFIAGGSDPVSDTIVGQDPLAVGQDAILPDVGRLSSTALLTSPRRTGVWCG